MTWQQTFDYLYERYCERWAAESASIMAEDQANIIHGKEHEE